MITNGMHLTPNHESQLQEVARAFVSAAFKSLLDDHVLPTPEFHPYLEVGRDYYGDQVSGPELEALERLLEEFFPHRFSEPEATEDPEFPSTYCFSLLEACIARCTQSRDVYSASSRATDATIRDLIQVLSRRDYGIACCREVTHLTTVDRLPVQLGGVSVVPVESTGGIASYVDRMIPGAFGSFNREDPRYYDPPQSLLVVQTETEDRDPFRVAATLSGQSDQFLLAVRLLYASTVESLWQVWGCTNLIANTNPQYVRYRPGLLLLSLIRRTTVLSIEDAEPIAAVVRMLSDVELKREGQIFVPFDLALSRFTRTFRTHDAWDNVVDLATTLEGVLIGVEKNPEAIGMRLRSRAAALLATSDDTGDVIFRDLGHLYDLRSRLVHGGALKEKDLAAIYRKISTISEGTPFGVALARVVDRMRDLARRAILARICLAEGPNPLWPFEGDVGVDAVLADTRCRMTWRRAWRSRLRSLGRIDAANPARIAVDGLSRDDR